MRYIFVGEKPSQLAYAKGVTWHSGGLAAKTLWDALTSAGIDHRKQGFFNLFGTKPDDEETVQNIGVGLALHAAHDAGVAVVGMGKKVQRWLRVMDVPHIPIVHPAARGKIRGKAVYQQHVRDALKGINHDRTKDGTSR